MMILLFLGPPLAIVGGLVAISSAYKKVEEKIEEAAETGRRIGAMQGTDAGFTAGVEWRNQEVEGEKEALVEEIQNREEESRGELLSQAKETFLQAMQRRCAACKA
jgi:flagellar biosynthesis/type III secretory pathway protein FliH